MEIPYRYDYPKYNYRIRQNNKMLNYESNQKDPKRLYSISLKELNKRDYLNKGLHLNKSGKYHLAKIITNHVNTINDPGQEQEHSTLL